jgi:hypothetical protein
MKFGDLGGARQNLKNDFEIMRQLSFSYIIDFRR